MIPRESAIKHLICQVILIINIFGSWVGISTIKKFIPVGVGYDSQGPKL